MSTVFKYANVSMAVEFVSSGIYILWLNRPSHGNAMSNSFWLDLSAAMQYLSTEVDSRVVVLAAKGKHFSVGLDLKSFNFSKMFGVSEDCGRKSLHFQSTLKVMQDSFSALQKAKFPIIAAVHGACIGGAVDLICSADIRICTETAKFSVFEINLGIPADLGTLQRLPKIIGNDSFCREMAFTGGKFNGTKAYEVGLCSALVSGDVSDVVKHALLLAKIIAEKSPVAITAVKQSLNFSRDHNVQDGLDHIASLNGSILQSSDALSQPPFARL